MGAAGWAFAGTAQTRAHKGIRNRTSLSMFKVLLAGRWGAPEPWLTLGAVGSVGALLASQLVVAVVVAAAAVLAPVVRMR